MSIKITTVVGEISEVTEFSTFEEYTMYVCMKMFLESTRSLEIPSDANIEDFAANLAETKKKGSVH